MEKEQIKLNEHLSTMHLNVAVYELMQKEPDSKETQPLYKQVNNPVLLKGFIAERRIGESYLDIESEMVKHFGIENHEKMRKYAAYPMEKLGVTRKINMMLIYGYMVDFTQPDPQKPVVVKMDEENASEKAIEEALTPKAEIYPFFMIVPETDNYMFDVSFSHVPVSAITGYSRIASQEPTETSATPPISMGPGTSGMYISPEDHAKVEKIHTAYKEAIKEFEEKYPGQKISDDVFQDLMGKHTLELIKNKTFKNKQELLAFAEKYAFMINMIDFTPDGENAQ